MSWLIWKMHRLYLKKWPGWRELRLPSGESFQVRYLAEGKFNYVFLVKGDKRLLKITKNQYYQSAITKDADWVLANCKLMNKLALAGLSVPCQHLSGGACLVVHAGTPVSKCRSVPTVAVTEGFQRLKQWCLGSGLVILDLNEDNYCWDGCCLRITDVDVNRICPLDQILQHPIARRRMGDPPPTSAEKGLEMFLKAEESLLCYYLRTKGALAAEPAQKVESASSRYSL